MMTLSVIISVVGVYLLGWRNHCEEVDRAQGKLDAEEAKDQYNIP